VQDITDDDLLRQAESLGAIIITTDSPLLERRGIVHGKVKAIWVPPSLTKLEQLKVVLAELHARFGFAEPDSRCMRCGGALIRVSKEGAATHCRPDHCVTDFDLVW